MKQFQTQSAASASQVTNQLTESWLPRSYRRRTQRGNAHGHAAPSGHGGERRSALHRFANEAKVVARVIVERYRRGTQSADEKATDP